MRRRIEKVQARLRDFELDALLVSSISNIRYLFGFSGSNAIALITSGPCFFLTDRRYRQQSGQEVRNAEIFVAEKDLYGLLRRLPGAPALAKLGVEAAHINVRDYARLRKILPGARLIASERIVERIASRKEDAEVESIRRAAGICREVIAEVSDLLQPGVCELDISAEISYRSRLKGSERDPFEPIVASGLRSALPHGISSRKKIENGDLVVLDFGATIDGYAADFTRTAIVGAPTGEQQKMADAVQAALECAERAARPGLTGAELDGVARQSLLEAGYGQYFQHSLGHGLGIEVHELPRIGERSSDPIERGNVVTLEPGIYLPEVGGIRIEDDFLITHDGAENLTPAPRGLLRVG